MRGGRDHLCSIGVEPPQERRLLMCLTPIRCPTRVRRTRPWGVRVALGHTSRWLACGDMAGGGAAGSWWRAPVPRISRCAAEYTLCHSGVEISEQRQRRRLSQAHPFSSSDAPRESTRDVQRRTTNGIVHAGSTLFTSAQTLSPCISPPKWSEPSRHRSTVGCPPVHRLKPGLYMP